jgi:hypothetical protein
MVPVLVLVGIALALIKSLMAVVARDEAAGISVTADYSPVQAYDPTVQLRARVHDDARGFLLPAAPDTAEREQAAAEPDSTTEPAR